MMQTQHESLEKSLLTDLVVARDRLEAAGGISLSNDTTTWNATNQFTKKKQEVVLPKMLLGGKWPGQNGSSDGSSHLVNEVQSLVKTACSVLQRTNEHGDMLCISTSADDKGSYGVGTYIPATYPDGTPNPWLAAVLRGETYVGRAFVANNWCVAACEPVLNADKKVVGALYVGVRPGDIPELRKGIRDIVVGKSGYVYVLGGSGDQKGRYLISYKGQRDGENIWSAKDARGEFFIQSVVVKARATRNGARDFQRYPWCNKGETNTRWKIAAVSYFEPWDWVIGAGTYEDDYLDAKARVSHATGNIMLYSILSFIVAFVVCGGIAFLVSQRLTAPLDQAVTAMEAVAMGDYSRRLEILSQDEVGRLSLAINRAVEATEQAVCDAKEASERERIAKERENRIQQERADAEHRAANALRRKVRRPPGGRGCRRPGRPHQAGESRGQRARRPVGLRRRQNACRPLPTDRTGCRKSPSNSRRALA